MRGGRSAKRSMGGIHTDRSALLYQQTQEEKIKEEGNWKRVVEQENDRSRHNEWEDREQGRKK